MEELESVVREAVHYLQQRLAVANVGGSFSFDIEARGRAQGGDVKITYILSHETYGQETTRGAKFEPVVREWLRRRGWDAENAPIAISYEPTPAPPIPAVAPLPTDDVGMPF